MGLVANVAKSDPVHCCIFSLLSLGFVVSMCGLAAIPVGDIRFDIEPVTARLNVTYPTSSAHWKGEKILVEFDQGTAQREFFYVHANHTWQERTLTRQWGSYTPGLKLNFPTNFYQPINEWKVVPEEMPLMWIAPMWCFIAGLLTLFGSFTKRREILLNALVMVGVAASLVLIASHRVVELTHFCSDCDAMTKYMSSDGKHFGALPDGAVDPDVFADNNCPDILHTKCEKGRDVYLAGGVINLICMYFLFVTIEVRRAVIKGNPNLASQDEMQTK